jgi:hypothetical protein
MDSRCHNNHLYKIYVYQTVEPLKKLSNVRFYITFSFYETCEKDYQWVQMENLFTV